MAQKQDPFGLWREQQRDNGAAAAPQPEAELELSPHRQARVLVAWCDWRLARLREDGPLTAPADDREWQIYTATAEKARAEQAAENYAAVPATIDGCIAVLDVAAQILEAAAANGLRLPMPA